ncbi:MAG TPA: hypothetical protein VNQ79_05295 [Blastocatellia bacterium]|nr:hypothetical protein [Blastocatellia bacterium]
MALETDWFKICPARWLNEVNRIPDASLRGDCLLVLMHCLNESAILNSDDEIAWITSLSVERVRQIRPWLNRLCVNPDAETCQPRLVEEAKAEKRGFVQRKAEAGRKRWEMRQEAQRSNIEQQPHTAEQAEPEPEQCPAVQSNAEQSSAVQSNAEQCLAVLSQSVRQSDSQTVSQTDSQSENVTVAKATAGGQVSRGSPRSTSVSRACDEEFLEELQAQPAYQRLNVRLIYSKMASWCRVNGKEPTRRRLINWLNREDQPLQVAEAANSANGYVRTPEQQRRNQEAFDEFKRRLNQH